MPSFPSVLSYKVFFWSNEGKPLEPVHVHVTQGIPNAKATKFWILSNGKVELADNTGRIPEKDVSRLIRALEDYTDIYIARWEEYHGVKVQYHDLQN